VRFSLGFLCGYSGGWTCCELALSDTHTYTYTRSLIICCSQLGDSTKPPDVVEKIVSGRLRKFYEEVCLTEQEHMVEEGGPKVGKALEALGLKIRRFEAVYV
jgi:translation elongation factor EF-Ts